MSATSSGSSCSDVAVKPTRSAKRTVMILRSRVTREAYAGGSGAPTCADVRQHAEDDGGKGNPEEEPEPVHAEKLADRRLARNTLSVAGGGPCSRSVAASVLLESSDSSTCPRSSARRGFVRNTWLHSRRSVSTRSRARPTPRGS